jgi:hypothetical protein
MAVKKGGNSKLKLAGPEVDDLMGAAVLGFFEAIKRVDLDYRNGLWAYALWHVRKEINREVKLHWTKGQTGETRADRVAIDNWHLSSEELAYKLDRQRIPPPDKKGWTPLAVVDLQQAIAARKNYDAYLTTAEGGSSGDIDGWSEGGEERSSPSTPVPGVIARQHFGCFDPYQLSPQLRHFKRASRRFDAWVVDLEKRAERRLKEMGRRQYALWLVRRQRPAPIVHLGHSVMGLGFDPPNYPELKLELKPEPGQKCSSLFREINKSLRPRPPNQFTLRRYRPQPVVKAKTVKAKAKRRTRIRVWRSYESEQTAAVAA